MSERKAEKGFARAFVRSVITGPFEFAHPDTLAMVDTRGWPNVETHLAAEELLQHGRHTEFDSSHVKVLRWGTVLPFTQSSDE